MFTRGDSLRDIQNWLKENKVVTVSELEYRRKGKSRQKRPLPELIYNWPDKSLYDILNRQEYVGHTVTAKTSKLSYKSNKTVRNSEEDQHFFYNTHEPLIDPETWGIAQKRIASRNRPTRIDEIDIFSGLIFCADCKHKLYLQRGKSSTESYVCAKYRNSARTLEPCSSHFIRKAVVKELVLADLQRVLSYVKENEAEFISKALEHGDIEAKKLLALKRRELDKATSRLNELDILFRKTYEDSTFGRITRQQFAMLTSGYEDEKQSLAERVVILEKEINTTAERKDDVNKFVNIVSKYTDIQELTYENVHEFIDKILIHECDKEAGTRKIEILYSFVGCVDSGESVTSKMTYSRKCSKHVNSIAI